MSTVRPLIRDDELGLWLQERREAAGLSQREAALLIGDITHVGIGHWERGENLPEPRRLDPIADAYKVDQDEVWRRWRAEVGRRSNGQTGNVWFPSVLPDLRKNAA